MRFRVALFLVPVILFAPGWNGRGRAETARGIDLTARMLAPTWDEGALGKTFRESDSRSHIYAAERSYPSILIVVLLLVGAAVPQLGFVWLLSGCCWLLASRPQFSRWHKRAPPLLQFA